ncbi:hypothetical protein MWU59_14290 [Flavobacteriaceae bacterium F08102]|nr:hypothetical protein [Flavobacteriaceae bacterium F08102]
MNIEKVLNQLSKEYISGIKVAEILNSPSEFPTEAIQKLSCETALRYWNGKITYHTGNYIMNNLYGFWTSNEFFFKNYTFSDIAWECFEAFDQGEYYHNGDDRNIDPVEKYTKPMIASFLKRRGLIT